MFRCKDLYTLSSLSKLKLVAGNEGLHKGIRWVYKAESMNLSQWVHGGELLIISNPVTSNPNFNLTDILTEAIHLNMSGALLLIGNKYVQRVSKSAQDLCNKKDFPLFAIPWDLPLVDFFEEIGHAITNSTLYQTTSENVLFSIIFENYIDSSILSRQLIDSGYSPSKSNLFFLLHFSLPSQGQNAGMENSINDNIREYLHQMFMEQNTPLLTSTYTGHILGIMPAGSPSVISSVFQRILDYIADIYPMITCNVGIGLPTADIAQLKVSYEQAAKCITYCKKLDLHNQIMNFDQLGIYHLLSNVSNQALLDSFVQTQIGTLLNYDEENHTQLVDTLYVYLQHNCNILHTANALYAHRNTIKYRLSRIEEILHRTMDDANSRLNIHLAIYTHKYIL